MAHESFEAITRLFARLDRELGPLADGVKRILSDELGSLRLTYPDHVDLLRMERNRRIVMEFKGNNIPELSARFDMTERGIRKVLSQQHACKNTGKIQHAVSQSHLIEPLEAAKEPDYGKAQSKRQWRNPC